MAENSLNPEDRERWSRIADRWIRRAVEAEHAAALPGEEAFTIDTSVIDRLFTQMQGQFAKKAGRQARIA